jgi:hypothetical protein
VAIVCSMAASPSTSVGLAAGVVAPRSLIELCDRYDKAAAAEDGASVKKWCESRSNTV